MIIFLVSLLSLINFSYAETDLNRYLKPTKYITSENRSIIETANKITLGHKTEKSKAIAIHNFVRDEIKFGFSTSFWNQSASTILNEKKGFCNTKTTLFIALLRAVKIPSRQIFVNINASILDGLVATGSEFVDHSYTEVLIEGTWLKTDSYIIDSELFESAQKELKRRDKKVGLGTLIGASHTWDGSSDAFSQFLPQLVGNLSTIEFGEYEDVGDFYSRNQHAINGSWLNRFIFIFIAKGINAKIQKVRGSRFSF